MKSQRLLAVARKEFIHLLRDPRSLAIGIALPIIMLLLFGFALTMDVDQVPIVIWNQNQDPLARDFVGHFQASRYFLITGFVDHYSDVERAIDKRKAMAGLIIPVDFSQQLQSGKTATVQWIVDGSDSNTATLATGYAQSVTQIFSRDIQVSHLELYGKSAPKVPLDLRSRVWFNADMESRNYIIPGLIAVIMMVIAGLLTSLTIAREWDTGTMEQLISTPVKVPELIIGKLIPYFCIAFLDVLIAVLMGEFLFHVPLRGNVFLIFATSIIFLIGALSLGIVISIATKSQLLASQIALVATFLPTFLLSGFSFDIANMPAVLQVISRVIPATYFIKILKGIYLKGVGLNVLYRETLFLIVFATLLLVVANVKFKKKMV
jgi:ABC-2 type transport system permease protein